MFMKAELTVLSESNKQNKEVMKIQEEIVDDVLEFDRGSCG